MFFVNPDEPIISTINVPPQQLDWFEELLFYAFDKKIPKEIIKNICFYMEDLMTYKEHVEYRKELMKEGNIYKIMQIMKSFLENVLYVNINFFII